MIRLFISFWVLLYAISLIYSSILFLLFFTTLIFSHLFFIFIYVIRVAIPQEIKVKEEMKDGREEIGVDKKRDKAFLEDNNTQIDILKGHYFKCDGYL